MTPIERALAWARAGYPVLPVDPERRRPRIKAWPTGATCDENQIRMWWARWPDAVVARVTGVRSGDVVLDIDRKPGKPDGLLSLGQAGHVLPPGPRYVTRSGGWHCLFAYPGHYCRTRVGVLPSVDTRGDGGYVVVYGDPPDRGTLPTLPPWLASMIETADDDGKRFAGTGAAPEHPRDRNHALSIIEAAIRKLAGAGEGSRNDALNSAAHTVGSLIYAVPEMADDLWSQLEAVAELVGLESDEIAATLASGWESGTLRPMGAPTPPAAMLEAPAWLPPGVSDTPTEREPVRGYYEQLQQDGRGQYRCNFHNAKIVIARDARYEGRLVYDEFQQTRLILDGGEWRLIRDPDILNAQLYMQTLGMWSMAMETVARAMEAVADDHRQHPVREWLNGLMWDGVERLSYWLRDYLGAEDSPYVRGVARMSLLQAVARIYEPGCKADYMTVLVGPQGIGKSTALRALMPVGDWFHDSPPAPDSDRMSQYLAGKWVVEFAELQSMSRADEKVLKSFLSSSEENYRRPYAREVIREPRQCVFFGTTNESVFLRDPTGARRYWPVETTRGGDAIGAVRDQIWAETVAAYRAGEPRWGEETFEELRREATESRYDADPWEEAIAAWIDKPEADGLPPARVTVASVALGALGLHISRLGRVESNRIASALVRLGWHRYRAHGMKYFTREKPIPVKKTRL